MKTALKLRLCCLLTAGVLMMPLQTVFASGDQRIGTDAVWDISDGVLTISGTGFTYGIIPEGAEVSGDVIECPWDDRREEIESAVVETGITMLGIYLFSQLPNLKTVWLADSVHIIHSNCFCDCPSLKEIHLPENVTLGTNLFDGDTALFPDKDFQIVDGDYLYGYTGDHPGTVTVPDGVRIIGDNCFKEHTEITEILLPDGTETVRGGAFQNCTALETVSLPDTLQTIGGVAFSGCTALRSVTIPDAVKYIGEGAFASCTGLQSIRLPASLVSLSKVTFLNCSALTEVTFAGNQLETIWDQCFKML